MNKHTYVRIGVAVAAIVVLIIITMHARKSPTQQSVAQGQAIVTFQPPARQEEPKHNRQKEKDDGMFTLLRKMAAPKDAPDSTPATVRAKAHVIRNRPAEEIQDDIRDTRVKIRYTGVELALAKEDLRIHTDPSENIIRRDYIVKKELKIQDLEDQLARLQKEPAAKSD